MDPNTQDLAGGDGVSIHTGFPNPALERRGADQALALDLNQLLVRHPSSTYLFRISGHQWVDQGIYDGDVAVIDRAVTPRATDLVISWQTASFALQRRRQLEPENTPWGVVTAVIHEFEREST